MKTGETCQTKARMHHCPPDFLSGQFPSSTSATLSNSWHNCKVELTPSTAVYSINSYLYFFIEHLNVAKAPEDVAFYIGIFLATFLATQTIMAPFWGCFSDYIGLRKPFVLIGALGTSLGFSLLGFSETFSMV